MRTRNLGLIAALVAVLVPRPAHAQGDFIKDKVKSLIEKSGVYVGASTRTAPDDDVVMTRSIGISYGTASDKPGWKIPFSISGYRADLETTGGTQFGDLKTRQVLSGIGYQWVSGKWVFGAQLGVGYSWNHIDLQSNVGEAFGLGPVPIVADIDNSFVVRPQVKAEYFFTRKLSLRTQFGYTYTDPDVVVQTPTETMLHQWRPHHFQANVGVGFFPFRK